MSWVSQKREVFCLDKLLYAEEDLYGCVCILIREIRNDVVFFYLSKISP